MERLLFQLANPCREPDQDALALLREEYETLLLLAGTHRVHHAVLQWGAAAGQDEGKWAETLAKRNALAQRFAEVASRLQQESVRFMVIKGPILQHYYGQARPRHSKDYDLILATREDYARAAAVLTEMGFEMDYFPLMTCARGRWIGLHRMSAAVSAWRLQMEMNIGAYPITAITWIDAEELFERAITYEVAGIQVLGPTAEDAVILLLAEVAGSSRVRIRDIVDFHVLLEGCNLDWGDIRRQVDRYGLTYDLDQMFTLRQALAQGLAGTRKPQDHFTAKIRPSGGITARRWQHQFNHLHRRGIRMAEAALLVLAGFWKSLCDKWTESDRNLKIVRLTERIMPPGWMFRHGIPVSLVPLPTRARGAWRWHDIPGRPLVISPNGCYLASAFCLLEEEELETAVQLADQLAGIPG